jgi:hypothetical protein
MVALSQVNRRLKGVHSSTNEFKTSQYTIIVKAYWF